MHLFNNTVHSLAVLCVCVFEKGITELFLFKQIFYDRCTEHGAHIKGKFRDLEQHGSPKI